MLNQNPWLDWRELYRWPFGTARKDSEQVILRIENLVLNNIYENGPYSYKQVLTEIVSWKTSGRQDENFSRNEHWVIEKKVKEVLNQIKSNPDKVAYCIGEFALENKLQGVGIPVASTFLRYLDPIHHRYGIIDKNIAKFLNKGGFTDFQIENELITKTEKNALEYEKFHLWLKAKAIELKGLSFTTIFGDKSPWKPVDIEMALFTYCTRNFEQSKNTSSPDIRKSVCPKCGSPLKIRTAKQTGEQYKGCTNYPQCNYNERSY